MPTYSYYVDPGYWLDGYTEDVTVNFVFSAAKTTVTSQTLAAAGYVKFGAGLASASSSAKAAANYVRIEGALVSAVSSVKAGANIVKVGSGKVQSTTVVLAACSLQRTYPGVNLNSKSQMAATANVNAKGAALSENFSSVKAGSRIFWENTSPASGTWTLIVPQAEGTGK